MSNPDSQASFAARLRTMQILVSAMIMGVAGFVVIAVLMRGSGAMKAAPDPPMVTYVAMLFTLPNIVAFVIMRQMVLKQGLSKLVSAPPPPEDQWKSFLALYQTRLIISAALLEGQAFFLVIAYLLEGQLPCLILALIYLVGLALLFPTQPRLETWLERVRDL